jgi:phage head maturation protease
VGFRVIEIEIPAASESKDGTTLIFRKQELLEFSICNVPANPWALVKNVEAGAAVNNQELNCPTFWGGLIQSVGLGDGRR